MPGGRRVSVAEAFALYCGITYGDCSDPACPDGQSWLRRRRNRTRRARATIGKPVLPHFPSDRAAWAGAPAIVYDYPVSMAALARRSPADRQVAERFEVYVCGLELANAFGELTDAAEQRARFTRDQARKQALYGETYPIDEDFLAALEHGLPPCAGAALGFDRLVMLATGADDIEEVLWAPVR